MRSDEREHTGLELLRRVEQFVYDEAELLDEGRFEDWLERFADDAVYWLPVDTTRHEPRSGLNLIYDDRRRLQDRVSRLRGGFSHTEEPLSRTSHVIGNVRRLDAEQATGVASWLSLTEDDVVASARTVIARTRRRNTDVFHGRVAWVLRAAGTDFAIRLKRVDLLGADRPLPALTFLL
jgi:3-phenylpropionate/cinnamic acid dioxygenase small subunit